MLWQHAGRDVFFGACAKIWSIITISQRNHEPMQCVVSLMTCQGNPASDPFFFLHLLFFHCNVMLTDIGLKHPDFSLHWRGFISQRFTSQSLHRMEWVQQGRSALQASSHWIIQSYESLRHDTPFSVSPHISRHSQLPTIFFVFCFFCTLTEKYQHSNLKACLVFGSLLWKGSLPKVRCSAGWQPVLCLRQTYLLELRPKLWGFCQKAKWNGRKSPKKEQLNLNVIGSFAKKSGHFFCKHILVCFFFFSWKYIF